MDPQAKNCVNTRTGTFSYILLENSDGPFSEETKVTKAVDGVHQYKWSGYAIYKSKTQIALRLKTISGTDKIRRAETGEITVTIVYNNGGNEKDVTVKQINYIDDEPTK